jgi:hypothetical protein
MYTQTTGRRLAWMAAFGQKREIHGNLEAYLVEGSMHLSDKNIVYLRAESVAKDILDAGFHHAASSIVTDNRRSARSPSDTSVTSSLPRWAGSVSAPTPLGTRSPTTSRNRTARQLLPLLHSSTKGSEPHTHSLKAQRTQRRFRLKHSFQKLN